MEEVPLAAPQPYLKTEKLLPSFGKTVEEFSIASV